MPDPKKIPIFADLKESMGFYTSKDFLPKVSAASKAGCYIYQYTFHLSLSSFSLSVCFSLAPPLSLFFRGRRHYSVYLYQLYLNFGGFKFVHIKDHTFFQGEIKIK